MKNLFKMKYYNITYLDIVFADLKGTVKAIYIKIDGSFNACC